MSQQLRQQIKQCMSKDQFRLGREYNRIKSLDAQDEAAVKWQQKLERSLEQAQVRRDSIPTIDYPALPVAEQKQAIADAIRDNQVVIVAGETGSGKTTQLPKICLELGLGAQGFIGHTQPRRLAARSVAARIAEELDTPIGELVGYKIRFNDQIKQDSLVKLMTDGMLLAEMQQDRFLSQYEVIIIDEAHERSLNIDFLLGLLKQLLPKRPDLKLIITSATIDPQRFSKHFGDAPMIEVAGRTYPVETRYRPVEEYANGDMLEGISLAVDELYREKSGDILIFMNGEREIRDAADFLNKRQLPNTDILPLFSRLSNAEQNRIFASHRGRRIVLATNVAETSLTVPGIRYVIDPGTARISRYSVRSKVQRLPIEAISQASANQRKGRCGRVAEGICIRLYSEDDFNGRPEFTDPEILRTNLASVVLQMLSLRLGDIEAFPFIDAPDQRNIKDGLNLLEELGALQIKGKQRQLTRLGRQLAAFPVDPRLARMLIAAQQFGCVREVMVICAALSIQDPRERPLEKQQAADQAHAEFKDPDSDFIAFLKLWDYLQEQQKALSNSQFRKLCKQRFLAYMRLREWQDIYSQLRLVVRELGFAINDQAADYEAIHMSITSGLLSHFGFKDKEREFLGARNTRFLVFPGSGQAKKPPKWVVASELVETSRLFARNVAKIQPAWLEKLAPHLVNISHSEPHWSVKQNAVMAYQSQRLYGVTIVNRRLVNFGNIDPVMAREVFIRSALVEGLWQCKQDFFKHNQGLLGEIEELEERQRRRDIRVDDQILFDFYAERIPEDIVSVAHFNRWWNKARVKQPKMLHFEREMLTKHDAEHVTEKDYPSCWQHGKIALKLSYVFEPSAEDDGVSVHVPLALLNQLDYNVFEWQIPAMREELLIELIRALPKSLRRNFVPAPNYARAALESMGLPEGRLLEQFSRQLLRMTGVRVEVDEWNWLGVPKHLRVNFKVINEKGKVLAESREPEQLQVKLQKQVKQTLAEMKPDVSFEQQALEDWSFGELPEQITEQRQGYEVTAYPALVDEGKQVSLKLFDKADEAQWQQARGLSKLIQLKVPSPMKYLQQHLPNKAKLGLYFNPFGKVETLIEDCSLAVIDDFAQGQDVRDPKAFDALVETVRGELAERSLSVAKDVETVLSMHHKLAKQMKGKVGFDQVLAHADIKAQLGQLVFRGFVRQTGVAGLNHLQRYMRAIERRLEKLAIDAHKDRLMLQQIQQADEAFAALKLVDYDPARKEINTMIQELRVSLFAQQLGTQYPISLKRVLNHIEQVRKERS
ncbi:ATP-dependent RNA helicase HrpA [Aliagarivorans marinus]|uniref:ATP-dependent RNA helicase HrpA n=1 Tax=Aliagarivorans marinus TaxID=561965 RepID=UPI001FE0DC15|nr:ATP-dependent RNA helicase HrpA [Aliagarivorans marinus]